MKAMIDQKKGYRDIEAEMEQSSPEKYTFRSEYDEKVKETVNMPLPCFESIQEHQSNIDDVQKARESSDYQEAQIVSPVSAIKGFDLTRRTSIEDEG